MPSPDLVTAGTIFEGTRKPLRVWFQAMWYITNQKLGVSALGLKRVLGLGSYQTAWTWLHKLRRSMVRPGRDMLSGKVEVDETYIGGEEKGTRGRKTETKAIVVIAIETHSPKGFGRVRLRQVPDLTEASLVAFIKDVVATGTTVVTDGWTGYNALSTHGFDLIRRVQSCNAEPADPIELHHCSSVGCLVRTRDRSAMSTLTTTWTSMLFVSTVVHQKPGGFCFIGLSSKRLILSLLHIEGLWEEF